MHKQAIIILCDTQRTDYLGCYGNAGMQTPCIDALSREGMTYERAYTCQPVCGPARSSMFTGLFPHSNGMWGNSMALGDNVKTLGQRLRDNGIRTGYVGKWHLDGSDYFGLGRCPDGWDKEYWYDMRCYLEEFPAEARFRSRQSQQKLTEPIRAEDTYAYRCTQRALDFIERYHDEDFLLVVSYDEPHHPSQCPEPFATMYRDYEFPKSPNVWDMLEGKPEHQRIWATPLLTEDKDAAIMNYQYFLGCNSFLDHEVGRVAQGIAQNTPDAMVMYTSDHGDMMRSHCLYAKGPAAYDEITRIPLIIKSKEVPAGTRYPHPASHIDMVPTILDYVGLPLPQWIEGKSMLPALRDPSVVTNDAVFIEFGRYEVDHDGFGGFQPMRCCFDGRYKLCLNLLSSDELYDLETDPQEIHNLIEDASHISVRNRLHDRILTWMNETRDPFRGYYWERRPWRTDAGEATWDYTGYTRQRENEEYEPRQLDYATGLEIETAHRPK